jgi:hypothetical protein
VDTAGRDGGAESHLEQPSDHLTSTPHRTSSVRSVAATDMFTATVHLVIYVCGGRGTGNWVAHLSRHRRYVCAAPGSIPCGNFYVFARFFSP